MYTSRQDMASEAYRDPKMAMMIAGRPRSKKSPSGEPSESSYSEAQTTAIKNRLQKSAIKKPSDSSEDRATKNKLNGY